jgi:phage-related protein
MAVGIPGGLPPSLLSCEQVRSCQGCYSAWPALYTSFGIQWMRGLERPRKLVWLVDSLDRLTRFPPAVRHKLGFALYQAQIGQKYEGAKMFTAFLRRSGRYARTIREGRTVQFTSHNSEKRFAFFMLSRRRQSLESQLHSENWT